MNKYVGLYIHIPFCKAKCHYCDFNSFAGKEAMIASYIDALINEIDLNSEKLKDSIITSIFIGGGTPSLIEPAFIKRLMERVCGSFNLQEGLEVSIESNPGTLTMEKLQAYRACGINRLSIGLQAWQDRLLKDLGRIHTADDYVENIRNAIKAGFTNINTDLIFGLPGQSLEDWEETLDNVLVDVTHLSCYSLKIEGGTVFGDRLQAGSLRQADDELDRAMYRLTIDKLVAAGFGQYEISNFAKPGYECRHNLVYWKAQEYLGLGAGAHSYMDGVRYNNVYDIETYINKTGLCENLQTIDKNESISEFMILGLRLTEGVSAMEFKERYDEDLFVFYGEQIKKLVGKGLLSADVRGVKLTDIGLDLANEVFIEFIQ